MAGNTTATCLGHRSQEETRSCKMGGRGLISRASASSGDDISAKGNHCCSLTQGLLLTSPESPACNPQSTIWSQSSQSCFNHTNGELYNL